MTRCDLRHIVFQRLDTSIRKHRDKCLTPSGNYGDENYSHSEEYLPLTGKIIIANMFPNKLSTPTFA